MKRAATRAAADRKSPRRRAVPALSKKTKDAPSAAAKPRPAKGKAASGPSLSATLVEIEVRRNGWPGPAPRPADLSLILQVEAPGVPDDLRVVASDRVRMKAASGDIVRPGDLPPAANGRPFFGGPVRIPDHVNLRVALFIERTNAVGPILGAALNSVVGKIAGRVIPFIPEVAREALHVQIGKTIATEIGRSTFIVPADETMKGSHEVAVALVAPGAMTGVYAPPGSPQAWKKGTVTEEGELVAIVRLRLELSLA